APVKDLAVTTVVNFTPATFDSSGGVSTYDAITRTDNLTWTQFAGNSQVTVSGTLSNDGTYTVHDVSGNVLHLNPRSTGVAALVAETGTEAKLALQHQALNDTHSLIDVQNLPIALSSGGTLIDGQTYYAHRVDDNSFTL